MIIFKLAFKIIIEYHINCHNYLHILGKILKEEVLLMINLNLDNLNPLELKIYNTILSNVQEDKNLNIMKASEICDVSSSKISKTVKNRF